MKNNPQPTANKSSFGYLLAWIAVYLAIATGVAAFGGVMYHKYTKYHLPSGNIELTVDQTRYQLGETVSFTVTNHFPVPVFVTNQCPSEPLSVYRWEHEKWKQLHAIAKEDGECYTQERNVAIPSEGTRSYDFDDWPELFSSPGVYRIAAAIDHYTDIPFQDFVVLEPAEVVQVEETVTESTPEKPTKTPTTVPSAAAEAPTPEPVIDITFEPEELNHIPEEEEEEYEYEEDDDEREREREGDDD